MGDDHHLDAGWNYANDAYAVGPVDRHDSNHNYSLDDYADNDDDDAEEAQAATPEEAPEAQAETEAVPAV